MNEKCHVCKKRFKPYTIIMNSTPVSLAEYFHTREEGPICEKCNEDYIKKQRKETSKDK